MPRSNQIMLPLTSRQMTSSNGTHRMQQSRRTNRERDQLILKRIALTIISIDHKAATERDEMMDIRHSSTIHIRELDDEILAPGTAELDRARLRGRGC